ncbi:MAG: TolC family protein [Deltaproteobacteria bacterium]|nr:MAG: TolC family protein [Deltaproteobacteria bacterium]
MKINHRAVAAISRTRPCYGLNSGGGGGKILLALIVIFLAAVWSPVADMALGEETPPPAPLQETETVTGPVNYERAVRLALRHSPYFIRSSLEIEVKRLDETDSKFSMVPAVTFRTQYYVNRPTERDFSNRPYALSFSSSNYNPVQSYFSIQARKLFTQIAILTHLQVITEGIQKLGRMFLEMDALNQAATRQKGLIELARQNLDYYQNRLKIGTGTSLEVRVAAREWEGAKAEKDRLASAKKRLQERMKAFIGLKSGQPLDLDCKDARRQVMEQFDPAAASAAQARDRSYLLKIAELKKELQKYHIVLAKARLMPSVFLGANTPDPLSGLQSRELFFSVGLEVPVWDGFERVRNISRQKTILRQFGAEKEEKVMELDDKWLEAQENLKAAAENRKAALDLEELASLKERQSEIRYHSGGEPLSVYLEGRKNLVEAQRNTLRKNMDYDLAVLRLRHLSGDLGARYVDAKSWQQ